MNHPGHPARWALAAALACAAATAAHAAEPPPLPGAASNGVSPERLQRLHAFLGDATGPRGYLGGVSLVMRQGRVVDLRAYGHRDLARTAAMREDAIFRIYSMSKTVTAVAVMMLVEEGRIALADPIGRHLPELARLQVLDGRGADAPRLRAPAGPVTVQALLTHTAGFPAGLPGDAAAGRLQERADPHGATDLRGFVARLARAPLAADPGTRFGYDGAGTEVLARLVEVASGEPFEDFLRARIFAPLGMRDTGFDVPPAQRARVVDITTMGDDGALRIADGPSARTPGAPLNAYDSGAGGLYSTASDYARFAQMLLDGGTHDGHALLGRKTVELMLRNHLTMLDPPVTQFSDAEGFGLGGYVVLDPARRGQPGSVGQFGWSGAASTTYTIDPQEKLLAILLLQHLPREDLPDAVDDLPRISRNFYGLVYQALVP